MEKDLSVDAQTRTKSHKHFISRHYSPSSFLLLVLGNVAYNVGFFSNLEVFISSPSRTYVQFTLLAVSLVMRLVALVQMWLIWFLKSASDEQLHEASAIDDKQKKTASMLQFMQSMYPILMSASLSIHILLEFFDNTCSDTKALTMAVIGLKTYPMVTFFLLRDTDLKALLCAWGNGILMMLICAIKFQSRIHFGDVLAFSFVSSVIFYDSFRQKKVMNQIVDKLQHTLELNDRLAVEAQALELRAMIGNVAHDLKTVRKNCRHLFTSLNPSLLLVQLLK